MYLKIEVPTRYLSISFAIFSVISSAVAVWPKYACKRIIMDGARTRGGKGKGGGGGGKRKRCYKKI